MSRQSTRGRPPHCSSSSAGSASYQGVSGATSPVYHLPQEPFPNNYRKKAQNVPYPAEETLIRDHHNYYNIQKPCCNKDSLADTHSYQYLNDREERKSYNVDNFSDDSSYYDYRNNDKRFVYSEYETDFQLKPAVKKPFPKQDFRYQSTRSSHHNHTLKDNHGIGSQDCGRVYPEAPLTRPIVEGSLPRRVEIGRISDRGNSPDSAGVGSAIVDGCGGHCVAFENVCSYVLQIFFVMGILIGVSLCIAGIILRRTKSRDLQVLVYIGAMSAMVCTLLLVVQCRVRRSLSQRKRAVRMARTATIPLNDIRPVHQPLITVRGEERAVIVPTTHQPRPQEVITEEQGVPWWRRTDLPGNRV